MSQFLLPSGIAQPQRLQTAIGPISVRALRTSVTIAQQLSSRPPLDGIAQVKPDEDESIHALVEMADEAMYQEKRRREAAA